MSEPRRILLGVLNVTDGEAIAIDLPMDADAETLQAAIQVAEERKAQDKAQESKKLREIFFEDEGR